MSGFDYYLILINVLGMVLYLVNMFLYSHTEDKHIDPVLTFVSLLGGSLGIVLTIALFDRKSVKENMMSRVFVICVLIIQIIIFLIIKGHISSELSFAFWNFFSDHIILVTYLIIINIATIVLYGVDKLAAIEHKSRIRIVTLLALAFVGGSIGGLIAVYAFRHKINKDYFTVGLPLIIITQIVVLFFLMNAKL